ncbi:unnamed protein product [Protopolystoma xenopodis]|uniref:Uncharacterized protein n=1 Tax=Protopolystoma xenopodis TaxID=117903 RepID=A0A448XDV6_9PLAT|nr:unnamed protein product [Protopolystoma xenopodis]
MGGNNGSSSGGGASGWAQDSTSKPTGESGGGNTGNGGGSGSGSISYDGRSRGGVNECLVEPHLGETSSNVEHMAPGIPALMSIKTRPPGSSAGNACSIGNNNGSIASGHFCPSYAFYSAALPSSQASMPRNSPHHHSHLHHQHQQPRFSMDSTLSSDTYSRRRETTESRPRRGGCPSASVTLEYSGSRQRRFSGHMRHIDVSQTELGRPFVETRKSKLAISSSRSDANVCDSNVLVDIAISRDDSPSLVIQKTTDSITTKSGRRRPAKRRQLAPEQQNQTYHIGPKHNKSQLRESHGQRQQSDSIGSNRILDQRYIATDASVQRPEGASLSKETRSIPVSGDISLVNQHQKALPCSSLSSKPHKADLLNTNHSSLIQIQVACSNSLAVSSAKPILNVWAERSDKQAEDNSNARNLFFII